jgi:hypothetical protein
MSQYFWEWMQGDEDTLIADETGRASGLACGAATGRRWA